MKKTIQVAAEKEALSLVTNVTYAQVPSWYGFTYEDLKMDIVIPKHRDGHAPMPAILWLCGGAFCVVDKSIWIPQMIDLARRGYVVASAQYRTSNAVSFPEPLKDVKAAVRFLRANAEKFCIDPNRIAAMGESAGGAMSSLVGTTAGVAEFEAGENLDVSSAVQAVVNFYGPGDFSAIPRHNADANVSDWAIPAFLGGLTPEKAAHASAVNYIDEHTPPFLIFHGTGDITAPIEGSEHLYNCLVNKGVKADFYVLDGAAHGDDMFYQTPVYDIIDDFLKANL